MAIRKIIPKSTPDDCLFYRSCEVRADHLDEEKRELTFTGSSEFEATRFGFTEVLLHGKKNIRLDRIKNIGSILKNHDPRMIVAAILSVKLVEKRLEIRAKFTTTQAGEDAFTEVKEGALKGISVGFRVHVWEVDEDDNKFTAIDWEPFEFSFTPIPVDDSVGVGRSLEEQEQIFLKSINRSSLTEDTTMDDDDKKDDVQGGNAPASKGNRVDDPNPPNPAAKKKEPAVDDSAARQEAATKEREDNIAITKHAESLDLKVSDYLGMSREEAKDKMLNDVANRDETKNPIQRDIIDVGEDAADKRAAKYADDLMKYQSMEVFMRLARDNGDKNFFDRRSLIHQILNPGLHRALETSASLGNVTILAADKALVKGFDSYQKWTDKIAGTRLVGDFKNVHSAGVTFGPFNEPGEGNPLTDLTVDDFGDTGSVKFRGGILHLTEEALWNDDLDLFFDALRKLGFRGKREEDKVIIAKLEAASFTGGSTGTNAFALAGLKLSWTDFNKITDASSELLGIDPMFIVLPSELYIAGLEETTTALGEATNRIFAQGEQALMPVNGRGLTDVNDWYLAADPNMANGFDLLKHRAFPTPAIEEIDAGTTIARKWKLKYPLGAINNNLKAGAPAGWYKNVVA